MDRKVFLPSRFVLAASDLGQAQPYVLLSPQ